MAAEKAISDLKCFLYVSLHNKDGRWAMVPEDEDKTPFPKRTVAIGKVTCNGNSPPPFRAENVPGKHAEKAIFKKIENELYFRAENDQGKHAEKAIFEILEHELYKTFQERYLESLHIVLYVTYSPCMNSVRSDNAKCAEKIKDFYDKWTKKHPSLTIEIVFSALYYIIRPSCTYDNGKKHSRCKHSPVTTGRNLATVSLENIEGLRSLAEKEDITLRAFQKSDWPDMMDCLAQYYGVKKTPASVAAIKEKLKMEYQKVQEIRTMEDKFMEIDLFCVLEIGTLQKTIKDLKEENRQLKQKIPLQQKDDMDMLAEADKEGKEEDDKEEKGADAVAGVEKRFQHMNMKKDEEKDEGDEQDEKEGAVAQSSSGN